MHNLHARQIWILYVFTYLWNIKAFVYAAPVDNEEALQLHITDVSQTIWNHLGNFDLNFRSVMRHIRRPLNTIEDIFRTYYKFTLSAIIQIVSGHI
jgi:hypothetical protein